MVTYFHAPAPGGMLTLQDVNAFIDGNKLPMEHVTSDTEPLKALALLCNALVEVIEARDKIINRTYEEDRKSQKPSGLLNGRSSPGYEIND